MPTAPALRPGWHDLVPALPLLVLGLAASGEAAEDQPWLRVPDAEAHVYVAVAALALLLRRRAPRLVLVVCGLAVSAYLARGFAFGPVLLTGPVAAWAVATRLSWREALAWVTGLALVPAAAAAPAFYGGRGGWLAHLAWSTGWAAVVGGVAAVGAALQVRRRSEEGVRAEQARRAVSEERLHMAQDVHDGVGHALAVVALHAGVAKHVLDRDPERVRELLTSIQATSREALDGLRADLDRWRSEDAGSRRPVPGLADLPHLLDRMRAGGLVLTADVEPCDGVPEEVGAVAYRVVQESLTNVLRHAGGAPAHVRVACSGAALTVEVGDRGSGVAVPVPATGSGIEGMRRRAASVGGSLTAGPVPGGGFAVRAELPLAAAAPRTAVAVPEVRP
ncbi:sensor histidine kinase [Geodermatophilus sp. URMC 63]